MNNQNGINQGATGTISMDKKSESQVQIKKVLLIDDQILFREGLESLFRSTPDFEMIGCAGTVFEGIDQATLFKPDIVLMDFSLPDGNGLDATRAILAQLPTCKIVFLTVYEEDDALLAALRLGAKGYLLKNVNSADLLASLRALDRGEKAVSRKMMSNALDSFSRIPTVEDVKDKLITKLSPREIDVLRELEGGATNLEIAQRLFLSENTVKHHIRNILDKLGVDNRREAAIIARQNSLSSKFPSTERK
jgi:DNA-binding NarL/FixJ family response regulator